MDVTCAKCGAEYEFDESLLGERGATVKCSSCAHVFRVFAKQAPARPALKLRFAKTGRVETLSSLRELQLRIRNGDVNGDDQLGRDGFDFRRLADVPELKNFFLQPSGPSGTLRSQGQAPLRVSETSMPPTSKDNPAPATAQNHPNPKRTVLGMGPMHPHIPPPPRVPNVPGALPAPSARAVSEPPRVAPPATISSVPTAPPPAAARTPLELAATRAPISTQPTAPQARAPQLPPVQLASEGPTVARPPGNTPRTLDGPNGSPVKLYLADDEAPPARAVQSGGKGWLYALMAVALGGAGWFGVNALGKSSDAPSPTVAAPATPAPVAAAAPAPGEAAAIAAPTAPSAPAPTGATQPPAAAPAPAATQAEPVKQAEAEKRSAGERDKPKDEPRDRGSRGSSDPSDYGGWVARGDQLFSRGDLAGARKAYESAVGLRATGSEANTGLGISLLAEGRARDALLYLDRAASSGYADAYIGLGDAYRKLGQKSNAVEAFETYLDRLPSGSKAKYARSQLENLKGASAPAAPAPEAPREAEEPSAAPPSDDYRPAGELTAPAAEPEAPSTASDESAP
jgi:predicted Zn finger-like uncharacterized protein